jgi:hypothetical protein
LFGESDEFARFFGETEPSTDGSPDESDREFSEGEPDQGPEADKVDIIVAFEVESIEWIEVGEIDEFGDRGPILDRWYPGLIGR